MNAGEYVLEHMATCYLRWQSPYNTPGSQRGNRGWFYVDWDDQDRQVGPFDKWHKAANAAEAAGFLRPERDELDRFRG